MGNNKDIETTTTTTTTTTTIAAAAASKSSSSLPIFVRYKKTCIIVIVVVILYLKSILFGFYSLNGGLIGLGIDKLLKIKIQLHSQNEIYSKYDSLNKMKMDRTLYYEMNSLVCLNMLCSSSSSSSSSSNNLNSESEEEKQQEIMNNNNGAIPMYLLQVPNELYLKSDSSSSSSS